MSSFADLTTTLTTPCLVVDQRAFDHNVAAMAAVNPGLRLRPHVKAFKSTTLARRLAEQGHTGFTCATIGEVAGMIRAGLGDDLLLANETLDSNRLAATVALGGRVTVAVDSEATIRAAATGGVKEVVIDVNVGLPRCGCDPADAGALADIARSSGMSVRGVMGYEGHLMMVDDREKRIAKVGESMAFLASAANDVGGDIISAGGTGTFDTNTVATEIQAGSYTLMDARYETLDLPFELALWVEATIISINHKGGWMVADSGLKSLAMDHGNPHWPHGDVWFCSDEHVTLKANDPARWSIGDHLRLAPAHVDPTVAKHERMWLIGAGEEPVEWPVDLRYW